MRKTRFTEEQILQMLAEHEVGSSFGELSRRHGVSKNTLVRWHAKYGGLQVNEAKRLRALEDENRRLKKLVAEQALDLAMLKDVVGRKW
jgi:putative transposase